MRWTLAAESVEQSDRIMRHRTMDPGDQLDTPSPFFIEQPSSQKTEKAQSKSRNNRKYFWLLFLYGTINHSGYVLVNTSAQSLARKFHKESFMAVFSFVLILAGAIFKLINSKYLLKVIHMHRIIGVSALQGTAFILISISLQSESDYAFYLALLGSILIGGAVALGETIILGFLKGFPPKIMSGWGSGTGFAGVFGATYNLCVRFYSVPDVMIFLGMTPVCLIYTLIFKEFKDSIIKEQDNAVDQDSDSKERRLAVDNHQLSLSQIRRIWRKMLFFVVNLPVVYFLQYSCLTGFADRATASFSKSPNFFERNVRKVWLITIFQFMNFVLWAIIVHLGTVPIGFQFVLMVWVGLNGGASYVNVYYLFLKTEKIQKEDKEIGLNLLAIMNDVGVLGAASLSIILANTYYK